MNSEILRQQLKEIYDSRGVLSPHLVLEAAANPTSPLHPEFEWDDTVAGKAYRLAQAAGLIREARITIVKADAEGGEQAFQVREYTAARYVQPNAPAGSYVPTAGLTGPEQQLLLQRMRREMASMRSKFGHLDEFWRQMATMVEQNGEKVAS